MCVCVCVDAVSENWMCRGRVGKPALVYREGGREKKGKKRAAVEGCFLTCLSEGSYKKREQVEMRIKRKKKKKNWRIEGIYEKKKKKVGGDVSGPKSFGESGKHSPNDYTTWLFINTPNHSLHQSKNIIEILLF